jgi:hypothetical protein
MLAEVNPAYPIPTPRTYCHVKAHGGSLREALRNLLEGTLFLQDELFQVSEAAEF